MRLRLFVIAVLATALLAIASSSAVAAVPAGFAGLVSNDVYAGSAKYQQVQLARERAAGFTLLRQTFDWQAIEPAQGEFSWAMTDRFVLASARARIRILPVLFGEPAWASSRPAGNGSRATFAPADPATFAAFAAAVASRYGSAGSFWKAHRDVKAVPIADYQIWNEPNLPIYWGDSPNAPAYARLLTAAAAALHAVQHRARVVTAGMPQSKQGVGLLAYLRRLYAAGAGPSIDAVAVNAYSPSVNGIVRRLRSVRKLLDARRGARTGLWVTEFGWSDNGPRKGYRVTSAKQAALIAGTYRALARSRRSLRLRGAVYFGWRDSLPYPGGKDFWGLHTGLKRLDGSSKPSIAAVRKALRSAR